MLEQPWTAQPDVGDWFSVIWLGIFGSGLAYVLYFRLLGRWGATRTSLVAYLLPVYGIVLGYLVLQEPIDADAHRRAPPSSSRASRWSTVRGAGAGCSARSPPVETGVAAPAPATAADREQDRPGHDQHRCARPAATVSRRLTASPRRTEPHAAANTVADSRSGATPDSGATLSAHRIST